MSEQVEIAALRARLAALEELLVDEDAFVAGSPIRGLPVCVIHAHQAHCGGDPEILRRDLERLPDAYLSKARGLAEALLAAALREMERRGEISGRVWVRFGEIRPDGVTCNRIPGQWYTAPTPSEAR